LEAHLRTGRIRTWREQPKPRVQDGSSRRRGQMDAHRAAVMSHFEQLSARIPAPTRIARARCDVERTV
jgi:hypothetical protein